MKLNYQQLKQMYLAKGYKFYEGKEYNANLFGIRNKDLTIVNKFNDIIGVAYQDEFMNEICLLFAGTTKPGLTYLSDKIGNPKGTFILMLGQYPKCWKIGEHNISKPTKYPAYVQSGAGVFKGYRDNNSDGKFDLAGPILTDVTGLNGHRAGINDTFNVGPYSAACQVVQDDKEFEIWLSVGKRAMDLYGNSFSYTLF